MKICLAQTHSKKGDVPWNMANHLYFVKQAAANFADLVVFPELSITGYEPEIAQELALSYTDVIFDPFQFLSDKHQLVIAIGAPTRSGKHIKISSIMFQPNKERELYSKQFLHEDEMPFFVPGNHQGIIHIKDHKIGLGICYETLQEEHFQAAKTCEIDHYIASVAKSEEGLMKASKHYSSIAHNNDIPLLSANAIGTCDNFVAAGASAVWNRKGDIIGQLDQKSEGLIIYDSLKETAKVVQLSIAKGKIEDLETVFNIYKASKRLLEQNGIFQWTNKYPTPTIIENDLKQGYLYLLKKGSDVLGAINLSQEQEDEYDSINWQFDGEKALVVHRLVINPLFRNQGHASTLMGYAEDYASKLNYSSIRLDAYSHNQDVIKFYKNRGYLVRGDVHFPGRKYPFHCMEKGL
ncbi:MAG: GNAT family N-acetyltransferase [Flavobacteriales bacterium]